MRENHIKTTSLGEGLRYDLSCTPRAFKICQNDQWDPLNAKRSSPQIILVWAMCKCMVSMATPYIILENGGGVGLQMQSYLGFYLS